MAIKKEVASALVDAAVIVGKSLVFNPPGSGNDLDYFLVKLRFADEISLVANGSDISIGLEQGRVYLYGINPILLREVEQTRIREIRYFIRWRNGGRIHRQDFFHPCEAFTWMETRLARDGENYGEIFTKAPSLYAFYPACEVLPELEKCVDFELLQFEN